MTVYTAFEKFKTRFLVEKKSIFSDTEDKVLTSDNIEVIKKLFIDKADFTEGQKFDEKLKKQFENASNGQKILFAHAIWLWCFFASDMKQESKKEGINKIISVIDEKNLTLLIPKDGIANTGQYHKTNKYYELCYIICFFEKCFSRNQENNFISILTDLGMNYPKEEEIGKARKVTMYNILLHLFKPDNYEPVASYSHKEKIVSFFESVLIDLVYEDKADVDSKLSKIKEKCTNDKRFEIYKGSDEKNFSFYGKNDGKKLDDYWKNDIELESKNIILHGAPGTGKTYSVENSIKYRLELLEGQDANRQFKMVQFHPSYGYEEFIDGIKPTGINDNGHLKLELKNGGFKEICIDAFNDLIHANKNKVKPKQFYFVADEVNRAELSRVLGEVMLCIEVDKRLKVDCNGKVTGTLVKTQNASLWKKEHAVVVLKDGKVANLDSENNFEGEDKELSLYFGIPENLYFIGTMNDIDRSIDSFDMALRRRFYWKHYECDYDVIFEKYMDKNNKEETIQSYIDVCKKLNKHIVSDSGFNLGESYQLGHSYFMLPKSLTDASLNKTWNDNIAPLLKEYLRAQYPLNEIDNKLVDAKKKYFTLSV